MVIAIHMPDGETIDVEVDDERFERVRCALAAKGQTFEDAFLKHLRWFLDQHPIIAQGKTPQ